MKRLSLLIIFITACWTTLSAQNIKNSDELTLDDIQALTDFQLDTINVRKALKINDYMMFGVQYGVGLSQVMWNPTQKQELVFTPLNFGVSVTKYQKMFGYMPYFGFQAGLFYAREGYQFKYNTNNDYIYKVEGAEKALIDVVEAPILFQFHYDMWNFKIMANVGCYAGYRLSIQRFPGETGWVKEELKNSFTDTDRRWDYGIKGGLGFAVVFDPVEIHFQAAYKHSLSSLYEPDHYSEYYYRFAYPSNIIASVGLHFHLSKRTGRTKAELKQMAKDLVYNPEIFNNGNTDSNSRTGNNRR
jgi:hypothetical protein